MLLASSYNSKNLTVWTFPGQGSRKSNMGLDLLTSPLAQLRLKQAEKILGWSIIQAWQSQDERFLNTYYTQPCLYVFMTLLVDLMKRSGYRPNLAAGYSFGEYVALYAAGAYEFETGLELIRKRGEIFSRSPEGSMVTLIGFDPQKLQQEIMKTANVWLANDDLKYAVISGTSDGIAAILSNVSVERVIPLKVSAAFHTPLVKSEAREFQKVLESTPFQSFEIPVFSSTDFILSRNINQIKNSLIRQITQPVKWQAISQILVKQGINKAVQIGSGKGLLKPMIKISPTLEISNISSSADINSIVIRQQLQKLSSLQLEIIEK